jgi:tetratricopeptide (TPR) repeat protein
LTRFAFVFLLSSLLTRGEPQISAARQAELAGDLPAAERAYEAEVKVRPSAEMWQRLGLVRHLQNKFEAAVPAFREAVRLDSTLWTSHLFLGICLYRTNQFAPALAAVEEADRLAPKNQPGRDEVDYWLGATLIAMERQVAGLQSLERLLGRNPKHVEALELATRTYAYLGSEVWNGVAERSFETAPGYEVHGHALESEGNVKDAIEAFRTAKGLGPERAGPGLAIGRLLLRQQKAEEALGVLKQEMALPGAHPETSYYAGLAAIQLGRFAEAAPLMDTAARWIRNNPEAPLALAQIHLALRDLSQAVNAARQAVAIAPASIAAHELLTAALTQAGRSAELDEEQRRWQEQQSR